MKLKNKLLILSSVFLFTGCFSKKQHKIEFSTKQIEVNSDVIHCEVISKIDDEEITKKMILNDKITLSDGSVFECTPIIADKLGAMQIKYTYDKQHFVNTFEIVDTKAPTIYSPKDEFEVEIDNEYFDIEKEVKISDNYDNEFFKEIKQNIDKSKVGEYDVEIKAKDNSGNESSKKLKVKIIEKAKEELTPGQKQQQIMNNIYSNNNTSNQNTANTNNSNPTPSPNQNTNNAPFINGISDISVTVDSDLGDMIFKLTQNISSSGSVSVDYSMVNLSVVGQYMVTYRSSDGANAFVTVNVTP